MTFQNEQTKKAFVAAVRRVMAATIGIDKVVVKKTGVIEAKRSYYYRMGYSAEQFAEMVQSALDQAGVKATVRSEDSFAAMPKESFFVAIITVKE